MFLSWNLIITSLNVDGMHGKLLTLPQGHLEFFLCNTDDLDDPEGVAVQSCFNKYPLTRASDDGSASPIDPTYPGRYYVDPPCREFETDQSKPEGSEPGAILTARYVLPQGVTCDRCIMQMIYCESLPGSITSVLVCDNTISEVFSKRVLFSLRMLKSPSFPSPPLLLLNTRNRHVPQVHLSGIPRVPTELLPEPVRADEGRLV